MSNLCSNKVSNAQSHQAPDPALTELDPACLFLAMEDWASNPIYLIITQTMNHPTQVLRMPLRKKENINC